MICGQFFGFFLLFCCREANSEVHFMASFFPLSLASLFHAEVNLCLSRHANVQFGLYPFLPLFLSTYLLLFRIIDIISNGPAYFQKKHLDLHICPYFCYSILLSLRCGLFLGNMSLRNHSVRAYNNRYVLLVPSRNSLSAQG